MPLNINDINAAIPPSFTFNSSGSTNTDTSQPYATHSYYNHKNARALERTVLNHIEVGATTMSFPHNDKQKQLALKLNCAKAYIVANPDNFDAGVVDLLNRHRFVKRGSVIALQAKTTPDNTVPVADYGRIPEFDEIVQYELPSKIPGQKPMPITHITNANAGSSQHFAIMSHLKELLQQPPDTGIALPATLLTEQQIENINAWLAQHSQTIVGRVKAGQFKAVKTN